jgi:hypothetical protein
MKKYRDKEGRRVVEVSDLSYLTEREHRYNWFQRHYHHHRLRRALKKASRIVAANKSVAQDIHRFYFIPNENIDLKH